MLRTLAGSAVPHPGFIAACTDLDVIGVVFYLMEEVDGFNPGTDVSPEYADDADLRYRVGLSYAGSLAELGNVVWENSELAAIRRPGSFLARQVPQFLGLLDSYRHERYSPESLSGVGSWRSGWRTTARPTPNPASCTATPTSTTSCCAGTSPSSPRSSTGRCARSVIPCSISGGCSCWPDEPNPINAGSTLAALGGLAHRSELIEAYRSAGGRQTDRLDWYVALACFKLGIVIEGTWSRYLAGRASRDAGEQLHASAENLRTGARVTKGTTRSSEDLRVRNQ